MFRVRKVKRGLWNAITELILVIASVVITLVVVTYIFGFLGAFGTTPTVTQFGTGILFSNGTAIITLSSTGNVQIVNARIAGTTYSVNSNLIIGNSLTVGLNTITIDFSGFTPRPGATYTILITLNDGRIVQVAVTSQ